MTAIDVVAFLFGFFLLLQIVFICFWFYVCQCLIKVMHRREKQFRRHIDYWNNRLRQEAYLRDKEKDKRDEVETNETE